MNDHEFDTDPNSADDDFNEAPAQDTEEPFDPEKAFWQLSQRVGEVSARVDALLQEAGSLAETLGAKLREAIEPLGQRVQRLDTSLANLKMEFERRFPAGVGLCERGHQNLDLSLKRCGLCNAPIPSRQ